MKYLISIFLLLFVFISCKEENKTKEPVKYVSTDTIIFKDSIKKDTFYVAKHGQSFKKNLLTGLYTINTLKKGYVELVYEVKKDTLIVKKYYNLKDNNLLFLIQTDSIRLSNYKSKK